MAKSRWTVPPLWAGRTVWIVCGGPSLIGEDLSHLKGAPVIAVNSSFRAAPFAQYCIFADQRWWDEPDNQRGLSAFSGSVVAVNASVRAGPKPLLRLGRTDPRHGISTDRERVAVARTTTTAAINLARHLGAARIIAVALDLCRDDQGNCHHHAPHPWANKPGNRSWDAHLAELRKIAPSLKAEKIEVIVASSTTRIDWWPNMSLSEALETYPPELVETDYDPELAARRASYTGGRARDYERRRQREAKWQREQKIVNRMLRELPKGARLIDVPCGTGRFADLYRDHGIKAVGVDISPDMLRQANLRMKTRRGDVFCIEDKPGSYDAGVCIRFANWVQPSELRQVLAELARVTTQRIILGVRMTSAEEPPADSRRPIHPETVVMELVSSVGLQKVASEIVDRGKRRDRYEIMALEQGHAR